MINESRPPGAVPVLKERPVDKEAEPKKKQVIFVHGKPGEEATLASQDISKFNDDPAKGVHLSPSSTRESIAGIGSMGASTSLDAMGAMSSNDFMHELEKQDDMPAVHSTASQRHYPPWVKKQLEKLGYPVANPDMPEPHKPEYESWKKMFEHHLSDSAGTLVGHSGGNAFLLRWLSEDENKDRHFDKLILVAPWIPSGKSEHTIFTDFEIDPKLHERIGEIHILVGSRDKIPRVQKTAKMLKEFWGDNAKLHILEDKGHFIEGKIPFLDRGMGKEFPHLLKLITGTQKKKGIHQ